MAEKNKNKLITIVLAIIICAAAITLLYVNLPQDGADTNEEENNETPEENEEKEETPEEDEEPVVILNVSYNNTYKEYTLEDLENDFTATTGNGRQVKSQPLPDTVIINPDLNESAWTFIGVEISVLLEEIENLPENYNVTITGSDDWATDYTKDNIMGTIDIYNETGKVTATTGATMIIAYKQDGEYIGDEYGPLRIAFVGSDVITGSNMWAKYVATIEVVEV